MWKITFRYKYFKSVILFLLFVIESTALKAQNKNYNWENLFEKSYFNDFRNFPPLRKYLMDISNSKHLTDLIPLSYGLDGLLAIFQVTDSLVYLNDALTLSNNVMQRAIVTKSIPDNQYRLKDNYLGWTGEAVGGMLYQHESPLLEGYFFQYVANLLRIIHDDTALFNNTKYRNFYNNTLVFVEVEIWDKWFSRGIRFNGDKYTYLLPSRTHIASHWAYMAAELFFITKDSVRKEEYFKLIELYNAKLEDNFDKYNKYITWNSTWNRDLKGNLNRLSAIVQDVAHGNQVVSYIVESYDLGLWKDTDAIRRIINTLKDKLWDYSNCLFKDNIDGTMFKLGTSGSVGSFQAAGFEKLSRYDSTLFPIYEKFVSCTPFLTSWHQYGQLFANLALGKKLFKTRSYQLQ